MSTKRRSTRQQKRKTVGPSLQTVGRCWVMEDFSTLEEAVKNYYIKTGRVATSRNVQAGTVALLTDLESKMWEEAKKLGITLKELHTRLRKELLPDEELAENTTEEK